MSCRSFMSMSSRAAPAMRPGRARSGAWCRRSPMTPRKFRISSARFAAKSGWVETRNVSIRSISARAAGLRHQHPRSRRASAHQGRETDGAGRPDPRRAPMWCYRDSLVVKKEGEARARCSRSRKRWTSAPIPARSSWGCATARAIFGMGISPAAAEKLVGRNDVAVTELRGMAMQGVVPLEQLSAIAMAKSLVSWHQRHGFCANCGQRTSMKEGGWKRECASCKAEHFPRTDPVVIMFVDAWRQGAARPAEAVHARHVFLPRRLCRSRRDHRGRRPPRDIRGSRHPLSPTSITT